MFRCQFSGEVSRVKESPVRLVIQSRKRTYDHRVKTEEGVEHFQTQGSEIVKEIVIRASHLDAAKKKFGLA